MNWVIFYDIQANHLLYYFFAGVAAGADSSCFN